MAISHHFDSRLYLGRDADLDGTILFRCRPDDLPGLAGVVSGIVEVGIPAGYVPPGVVGTIELSPLARLNILPREPSEDRP